MASTEQIARLHAVVNAAQVTQRKYGVPASVTLAQWITESSWGASRLATAARNYFGIKATHLDMPELYVEFPTAEYEHGRRVVVDALFEKYFDAADCFEDHARLLATASRYRTAMNIAHDPDKFALELQKCGYSTSPRYGLDLIDLMREFNLYQFDAPPDEPAKALEAA